MTLLQTLDWRGLTAGLSTTALLAAGILLGSRNLRDYDPALLMYTFGSLGAVFNVAYRYTVWLRRPPTRVYWRRGWSLLCCRGEFRRSVWFLFRSASSNLLAQRFIRRRSRRRWFAHLCFAWGCTLASAVTFPLVFGWLHFESRPSDPRIYQVFLFGLRVDEFHLDSLKRHLMFNLLNVSAFLVILGTTMALHRRLRSAGSIARQQFGDDLMPLLLLLAIAITGLMLTFSSHLLQGYGYGALSLIHAMTVVATLLYLPFGKFFHIFQRPAQLSVALYKRAGAQQPALCRVCGEGYGSAMQVSDLKVVLGEVGFEWGLSGLASHYAEVCPGCRRRLIGFSQGRALQRLGASAQTAFGSAPFTQDAGESHSSIPGERRISGGSDDRASHFQVPETMNSL